MIGSLFVEKHDGTARGEQPERQNREEYNEKQAESWMAE